MADPTRFLQMLTLTRGSTLVFRTWEQTMEEDRDSGRKWETNERKREVKLRCGYNVTTPISITYTLHQILAEGSNMYDQLVQICTSHVY